MKTSLRDKLFIAAASVFIIGVMLWCPVMTLLQSASLITLPQSRNVKSPQAVYEEGAFLSHIRNSIEQGKALVENTYTNALPLYEQITAFMLDSERAMRQALWVAFLPTEQMPEQGQSGTRYTAKRIGKDDYNIIWAITEEGKPYSEGWTDKTLIAGEEELELRLDTQLWHVNRIASANTDVNFFVYIGTRFQDTQLFGEIVKDIPAMRNEISTYPYMQAFIEGLDTQVIDDIGIFDIDTLSERLLRIYRTDHHQSAQGAYDIYADVTAMIQRNAPGIVDAYPLQGIHTFEGVKLMGSHVWGAKYSEISESFRDYIVDLPKANLRSWEGGSPPRLFDEYKSGAFIPYDFTDHYGTYYSKHGVITYPDNETGRNLLIIGDSYCWASGELIAAGFDNTYIMQWTHEGINYKKFLEDRNITDVLVMQVADRLLFDIQNDTQLGRVFTGR